MSHGISNIILKMRNPKIWPERQLDAMCHIDRATRDIYLKPRKPLIVHIKPHFGQVEVGINKMFLGWFLIC